MAVIISQILPANICPVNKQDDMKQTLNTLDEEEFDRHFKPKGAIAFFVLLVILALIIWYGIYFLMLSRI